MLVPGVSTWRGLEPRGLVTARDWCRDALQCRTGTGATGRGRDHCGVFLEGDQLPTFSASAGQTQGVDGVIADMAGADGPRAGSPIVAGAGVFGGIGGFGACNDGADFPDRALE